MCYLHLILITDYYVQACYSKKLITSKSREWGGPKITMIILWPVKYGRFIESKSRQLILPVGVKILTKDLSFYLDHPEWTRSVSSLPVEWCSSQCPSKWLAKYHDWNKINLWEEMIMIMIDLFCNAQFLKNTFFELKAQNFLSIYNSIIQGWEMVNEIYEIIDVVSVSHSVI